MVKIVKIGEDRYRVEMEASDAQEDEVKYQIETIVRLAQFIESHGYSPDIRAKDRRGYWRYAEVERSLNLIRAGADTALRHIKFLDFPEDSSAVDPKSLQ